MSTEKLKMLTAEELTDVFAGMTQMEIEFCEFYVLHGNARKASRQAGLSEGKYTTYAYRNLERPSIKRYISHLKAEMAARADAHRERVIDSLAEMAFLDPLDVFQTLNKTKLTIEDLEKIPKEVRRSLIIEMRETTKGTFFTIKTGSKEKALELLGKASSAFTENINVQNDGGEFSPTIININHRAAGEEIE